LGLGDIDMSL
jgi:hypothetical protein